MIKLTLPYPPSVNEMYVNRNNGQRRGRVMTAKGHTFKSAVATIAMVERAGYIEEEVKVTIRFYRPRRVGDIDNRIKATLDAMKGVCWRDDSQVVELHTYRFDDKRRPRVEVEIEAV